MSGPRPSRQPVEPTVQIHGNHNWRSPFTCCQVFPLLHKIILPTIFDITDDPAASKTSRYRTYASKFRLSNGSNYKWQIAQSLYLWDNSAFVASERALPSFAVPLRNDNHSFSLSLVRFRGQLPLSNCTFSSAEKKAASGRFVAGCIVFFHYFTKEQPSLINVDPIASLWCLLTERPLDRLGGVLNFDKSYCLNFPLLHLSVSELAALDDDSSELDACENTARIRFVTCSEKVKLTRITLILQSLHCGVLTGL